MTDAYLVAGSCCVAAFMAAAGAGGWRTAAATGAWAVLWSATNRFLHVEQAILLLTLGTSLLAVVSFVVRESARVLRRQLQDSTRCRPMELLLVLPSIAAVETALRADSSWGLVDGSELLTYGLSVALLAPALAGLPSIRRAVSSEELQFAAVVIPGFAFASASAHLVILMLLV